MEAISGRVLINHTLESHKKHRGWRTKGRYTKEVLQFAYSLGGHKMS